MYNERNAFRSQCGMARNKITSYIQKKLEKVTIKAALPHGAACGYSTCLFSIWSAL